MKDGFLRNFLAVIAGFILGSVVNMAIVTLSPYVFGAPEGVNTADIESIKANIDLYQTKHFIGPILAHALGTLVGAFITAKIVLSNKVIYGSIIGVVFLLGGLTMVFLLPEQPTWVKVVDLGLAYFPMAYLGSKMAK